MTELGSLRAWFQSLDRVVLGYSGGVDSALLAVVGGRALGPECFLAVVGRSASYPEVQWATARAVAAQFSIPLREIETDELADPAYRSNPTNRCYFCKRELWSRLRSIANEFGGAVIVDGTNLDDLSDHRPGRPAGLEVGVRSPLVELGWTKSMVRRAARGLGLPIWDAPAGPCLASRIQYGLEVTRERLAQVESGERILRGLGVVGDLRVRHHGARARIEVRPEMFGLVDGAWETINRAFRELGFEQVTRDPTGYRRGGLLPLRGGLRE